MVVCAQGAVAGGSQIQSQPRPHSEFKADRVSTENSVPH